MADDGSAISALPAAAREQDAATSVSLPISGMTCASCVRRVERAITAAPSVAIAAVNLASERAEISFAGAPDLPAVISALDRAGYGVVTDTSDLTLDEKWTPFLRPVGKFVVGS